MTAGISLLLPFYHGDKQLLLCDWSPCHIRELIWLKNKCKVIFPLDHFSSLVHNRRQHELSCQHKSRALRRWEQVNLLMAMYVVTLLKKNVGTTSFSLGSPGDNKKMGSSKGGLRALTCSLKLPTSPHLIQGASRETRLLPRVIPALGTLPTVFSFNMHCKYRDHPLFVMAHTSVLLWYCTICRDAERLQLLLTSVVYESA